MPRVLVCQYGWYFDDASKPTKIILCDNTCQKSQSHDKGKIDVLFNCKANIR